MEKWNKEYEKRNQDSSKRNFLIHFLNVENVEDFKNIRYYKEKAFWRYLQSAEWEIVMDKIILDILISELLEAFQWYLKSAEGEDSYGQYNLGNCNENGIGATNDNWTLIGTTKGDEKAFQWYLKSDESGNYCYKNGIGTAKDEGT
ncbi:hypothetical protein Glove_198g18 [Diversispora epigaea]|uniref:Uncharacterized protein n=1 Tax=Diversispora epigaea TaxID=1348612 RepID=A0A397ITU8_9GLOM|nr:hypothetical protein Glove_198g18 [Diversispora epigaea]